MISLSAFNKAGSYFIKDSLNYSFNKKVEKNIDLQNEAFVRRLRSVSSQYGQKTM